MGEARQSARTRQKSRVKEEDERMVLCEHPHLALLVLVLWYINGHALPLDRVAEVRRMRLRPVVALGNDTPLHTEGLQMRWRQGRDVSGAEHEISLKSSRVGRLTLNVAPKKAKEKLQRS